MKCNFGQNIADSTRRELSKIEIIIIRDPEFKQFSIWKSGNFFYFPLFLVLLTFLSYLMLSKNKIPTPFLGKQDLLLTA